MRALSVAPLPTRRSRRLAGWLATITITVASAVAATNTAAPEPAPSALNVGAPLRHQVVQRATRDGGMMPVRIEWATPLTNASAGTGPLQVEARLVPSATNVLASARTNATAHLWHALGPVAREQTRFSGTFPAPAGGWYRLEVRLRDGQTTAAEGAVDPIAVGEVFVVAGQSNSANHGEERQRSQSGLVAAFSGRGWQPAHDPQPGASGDGGSFLPPFGDAMARKFGVPVGLVAVGAGGTSVREWLPRGDRFPHPPTVEANVRRIETNGAVMWESRGSLHERLATRLQALGPHGFRALLWHQGESDANQRDPSRTLPGTNYQRHLTRLIEQSRRDAGWTVPWFVAQVSYHTPDDPGSDDIRNAQARLWQDGVALQGPDTDALTGPLRDGGGRGVHFSGPGLRAHGALWADRVGRWLEPQLQPTHPPSAPGASRPPGVPAPPAARRGPSLRLPTEERFEIAGRPAFLYLPAPEHRLSPQPWIVYAPTLGCCPDEAERWMHERFLAAGVAVAGVDVGEAYGQPGSHAIFQSLYAELTLNRGFAAKPCLLGRSRGGLWATSWALSNPGQFAGFAGIYPVLDLRSYPGLDRAAPAYGLTRAALESRLAEFNPVARLETLARAGLPVVLIHGDVDRVVPLEPNSGELIRQYRAAGAADLAKLILLPGQGHNMFEGFFRSQELVDFAIARAKAGR